MYIIDIATVKREKKHLTIQVTKVDTKSMPPKTMGLSEKENEVWHADTSFSFTMHSCLSIAVFYVSIYFYFYPLVKE